MRLSTIFFNICWKTRIIRRTYAITEENNKKKVMYSLSDGMFMFWHKFIPRQFSRIEIDNGKQYYLSQVKPSFMSIWEGNI